MKPSEPESASNDEELVRQTVEAFYNAFNAHGFTHAETFTSADWNHINPGGGWTSGRENVLRELNEVHSTFLKGVSDTIREMSVRFVTADVAIAIVTGQVSAYVTPDGVRHEHEHHRRSFVLSRSDRWRVVQDQNTIIQGEWV